MKNTKSSSSKATKSTPKQLAIFKVAPRKGPKLKPAISFPSKEEYIEMVNRYQDSTDLKEQRALATKVINALHYYLIRMVNDLMRRNIHNNYDDLMQVARIGVLNAMRAWDREKAAAAGAGFFTYVHFWLVHDFGRYHKKEVVSIVRLPYNIPEEKKDLPEYAKPKIISWSGNSRRTTWPQDEMKDDLGEFLLAQEGIWLENDAPRKVEIENLNAILQKGAQEVLSPRDWEIVQRCSDGETYAGVAVIYGLSRERIRQIENKAHLKLRRYLAQHHKEVFGD